jgi:DNA recombination protein RmuC
MANFTESEWYLLCAGISVLAGLVGAWLATLRARQHNQERLIQMAESHQFQLQSLQGQIDKQDTQIIDLTEQDNVNRAEQLSIHSRVGQLSQQVERIPELEQEKSQWQIKYQQAQQQVSELQTKLESQGARFEQEKIASDEKLRLLEVAEERLKEQFENVANKIFEQKQTTFSQTSKANLDSILSPLKQQIDGFKRQVTDQYVKEGQERASLKTEILGLKELNQQITQDAAALTKALKGDNKAQGNWGEVILDRVLKESGLREGHEFETQVSLKNETGKLYQPDVVIHLPNDKDIVVDSKVSLSAYERYFNEQEDDKARALYLKEHINSLRNHIKELGKKDYQDLKGIRSLDYVLMFIPIEAAFLLAADHAPDLLKLAFDNNIMLVSPTNLLVALRTVNNIWQYEYQNQNAQKIAENAAKLYDKFHGFMVDMDKIDKALDSSRKHFDGAMNKLSTGKGNIVRQIEQFKKLGVQTNKRLDEQLLQRADNDGDLAN